MPKNQKTPLAVRLDSPTEKRLTTCAERVKQSKHHLMIAAIEAAVDAIERNDYRIVVPIAFAVTHEPRPAHGGRWGEEVALGDEDAGKSGYSQKAPRRRISA
jgi:predicted DNA-binding protein